MVRSPAAANGVLLDRTQARQGLARVPYHGCGAGDGLDERSRHGRDAGEVREDVEDGPLSGQQRAGRPAQLAEGRPCGHPFPVAHGKPGSCSPGTQPAAHFVQDQLHCEKPCDGAGLAGDDGCARPPRAYGGARRVAVRKVLCNRAGDNFAELLPRRSTGAQTAAAAWPTTASCRPSTAKLPTAISPVGISWATWRTRHSGSGTG